MRKVKNTAQRSFAARALLFLARAAVLLALLAGFAVEAWGGRYGIPTWRDLYARFGFAPAPELPTEEGTVTVTVLDVGQGDAVLIACNGETCLIDAGTMDGGNALANTLRDMGVRRLDLVVLTHPHSDHGGGMPEVLRAIPANVLLLPPVPEGSDEPGLLAVIRSAAREQGTEIAVAETGQEWPLGGGTLTVLQADFVNADPAADENTAENDASLCLRYEADDFSFLDTGDAGAAAEENLVAAYGDALHSTLFKAGHHGSNTSNSEALLRAVRPQAAAISCGLKNDYGHPHAAVLQRLQALGIQTARTDQSGTLTWLWQNGELTLQTAAGQAPAA